MKKVLFFLVALFLFSSQKCKDDEPIFEDKIDSSKSLKLFDNQNESDYAKIELLINKYVSSLSNSDLKFVDSISCSNLEFNIQKYEEGVKLYGFYSVKSNLLNDIIQGDLNGDDKTDYIVNYFCENCFGGGGAGNYLSNCLFITSKNDSFEVNETMTFDFKKRLINAIKENFGEEYEGVKPEKEYMINGIEFTEIKNQNVIGTFNINTEICDGSPFPCVKGTFEYHTKNKTFVMNGTVNIN